MLALDFLRAAFTDGVLFGVKMTCVSTPLVGVVMRQTEGIEQRFELYDFGTKVDIKIPPRSQVTDVTDLAAAGAATIGP